MNLHQGDYSLPLSFVAHEQGIIIWDANLHHPTGTKPTGFESKHPARWVATANILEVGVMEGSADLQEIAETAPDVDTFFEQYERGNWREQIRKWLADNRTPPAAFKRMKAFIDREGWLTDIELIRALLRDVNLSEDVPSVDEIRCKLLKYAADRMVEFAGIERSQGTEAFIESKRLDELREKLQGRLQPGWENRVPYPAITGAGIKNMPNQLADAWKVSLAGSPEWLLGRLSGELITYPGNDVIGRLEPVQRLARLGRAKGQSLRGIGRSQEGLHFLWWKELDSGQERIEVVLDTAGEDVHEKLNQFRGRISGQARIEAYRCSPRLRGELHRELELDRHARFLIEEFDNDKEQLPRFYIELEARLPGEKQQPAEQLFSDWLESTTSTFLVLFGDYGAGKTTVIRKWARGLAEAYLKDSDHHKAPALIDLRFLNDNISPEALICSTLKKGDAKLSDDLVRLAIEEGLLVIILDGFDEMASHSSEGDIAEQFLRFASLARGPRAKILLTCRPSCFASGNTLRRILEGRRGSKSAHLQNLNEKNVREYVRKRTPGTSLALEECIQSIEALRLLSKQPLLLNMIVEAQDRILTLEKWQVTKASLFQYFVNERMDRSCADEEMLAPRFFHKSFFEYFLAKDIYEWLKNNDPAPPSVRYISKEVAKLFDELINDPESAVPPSKLHALVSNGETVEQRAAALVASYYVHSLRYEGSELRSLLAEHWGEGLDLVGADFSGLSMPFLSLVRANLTGASFVGADLSNSDFSRAHLDSASLESLNASHSDFRGADLKLANLEQAIMSGVQLSSCCLDGASLAGVNLERANLANAKMNRVVVRDAKLIDTILTNAEARGADFRNALFLRVEADGLILDDADLSGVAFYGTQHCLSSGTPRSTYKAALAPREPKGLSLPQPPWRGGGGTPFSVEWSRDGSRYVVASWDRKVRIFDAVTDRLQNELSHEQEVRACHFTEKGDLLVTGCYDGRIRFFDTYSGIEVKVIDNGSPVKSFAISDDNRWLVAGSVDKKARIYDIESQVCLVTLDYESSVTSCAFSKHGSRVAITCSLGELRVYDTSSLDLEYGTSSHGSKWGNRNCIWDILHLKKIRACAFSPDGSLIATCCIDGWARVFKASSGTKIADYVHEGSVWACAFSPDSQLLLTGADDGKARLFKIDGGEIKLEMEHGGWVWGCAFSPGGKECLTSCDDGKVRIYDVASGELKREIEHGRWVRACAISKSGNVILAACSDAKARLFDARNGQLLKEFDHGLWVRACDISEDNSLIVTGCADGLARVFDMKTDEIKFQFNYGSRVRACAFSPGEQKLLTGCGDGKARLYDLQSNDPPIEMDHGSEIWTCSFSPKGDKFLTGCASGLVRLYDAKTASLLRQEVYVSPGREELWVRATAFSPDGTRYVTGCRDGCVRVYDTSSGIFREIPNRLEVWTCAFSGDGAKLVTSSGDCKVKVYDANSFEIIHEFAEPGWVWSCKFSPDSSKLITCCDDGRIRLYDADSWSLVLTIVAAFSLPHGQSPTGYISLPKNVDLTAYEVICRDAAYPLSLLVDVLNQPDLVAKAVMREQVDDLNECLKQVFPELAFPDYWPKPDTYVK